MAQPAPAANALPPQQLQVLAGFPDSIVRILVVLRYSGVPDREILLADQDIARDDAIGAVTGHFLLHEIDPEAFEFQVQVRTLQMDLNCEAHAWPLAMRNVYEEVIKFNYIVFRDESGFCNLRSWPVFILGQLPAIIRAPFTGDVCALAIMAGVGVFATSSDFLELVVEELALAAENEAALGAFLGVLGAAMAGGHEAIAAAMAAVAQVAAEEENGSGVEV